MNEIKYCDYGCEQIAEYQLSNGKYCCEKTTNKCPAIKTRIRDKLKGKVGYWKGKKRTFTQEWKDKIGESLKGKPSRNSGHKFSDESKKKLSESMVGKNKGKKKPDGFGKKMCEINKGRTAWNKGITGYKIHDDNFKKQLSKRMKDFVFTEEIRDKLRKNVLGDKNPSKREDCKLKIKQRMLNGGAFHAASFVRNPSKPQVKLFNMIKEIYPSSILNYSVKQVNRNIDIAIPEFKIAIEYDGIYWHQDRESDLIRQKQIENLGWKFIRYDGGPKDSVPEIDMVINDIKNLIKEIII
jgi:very-short-patch-repair endonuclease